MAKKPKQIDHRLKPVTKAYDHNHRVNLQNFTIYVRTKLIIVPANFIFDGASIPRPAWSIVGSPFQPEFEGPAMAHDLLYETHQVGGGIFISRLEADKIFRELLAWNNIGPVHRQIMYRGVRLGGRGAWKR